MPSQAKCTTCKVRFVWDPEYLPKDVDAATRRKVTTRINQRGSDNSITNEPLRKLACRHCNGALEATSYHSKLLVSTDLPVYREGVEGKHRSFPPEFRKRSRGQFSS